MQIGTMYAVKHLPTNKYLPIAQKGKSVRGASFVDPVAKDDPENPIRLFTSAHGARIAITAYCKGEHHHSYQESGSLGFDYDCVDVLEIKPVEWRKKEDFAVVTVTLNEVANAD